MWEQAPHHQSRATRHIAQELDHALVPERGSPIATELNTAFSDDVAMNILFRHLADLGPDPVPPTSGASGSPTFATNIGAGVNIPVGGINVDVEAIGSLPGHPASHMEDVGTAGPAPAPVPGDVRQNPTSPVTPAAMNAARNVGHAIFPHLIGGAGPTAANAPVAAPRSLDDAIGRVRRSSRTTDSSDR